MERTRKLRTNAAVVGGGGGGSVPKLGCNVDVCGMVGRVGSGRPELGVLENGHRVCDERVRVDSPKNTRRRRIDAEVSHPCGAPHLAHTVHTAAPRVRVAVVDAHDVHAIRIRLLERHFFTFANVRRTLPLLREPRNTFELHNSRRFLVVLPPQSRNHQRGGGNCLSLSLSLFFYFSFLFF